MLCTQAIKTFDALMRNQISIVFEVIHLRESCHLELHSLWVVMLRLWVIG
jgi:hypothetical protein